MDRIINVKVGGNYLSKDNKNAGVQGEGNVTHLRITFDEGWDGYAKTVTFFDAHGGNPVKRVQGVDLIENIINDVRTYITPIPKEPLAIAGELTFVIDGYLEKIVDGEVVERKKQRSVSDKLIVKYAPDTDNAGEPTDPTPEPYEQLQTEIDKILKTIQEANISKEAAVFSAESAGESAEIAISKASEASESALKAENALGKTSYIGKNGNWYAWDNIANGFYDTGVKAQAGSTVYLGANPPPEADVWVDPDGDSALCTPYIGENGNWYVFDAETNGFKDTGIKSAGYTPVKGEDYWTEEDKEEILKELSSTSPTRAFVNILGGDINWKAETVTDSNNNVIGSRYGQVVNVNNAVVTPNSKVDLQISSEQMVIFHEKDLAFVAENEDGVVTIYCIGSIPKNNYTLQVTVTEVIING